MKLGCCLSMNAAASGIGDENAGMFKELGYDYIELPLAQMMELSDVDFASLRKAVEASGIPMEACNNCFPATLRLTGENADHNAAAEYMKRAVERVGQLGGKIVVLGSSGAKNIPEGFPYEKAREQFLNLLGLLQGIVAPYGITMALEPLNSTESNFVITASEGLEIVREVNLPNIKLLIDYYHMRMENEGTGVIAEAGSDLRHLHVAAKNGRVYPKKEDGEDYAGFFGALKSAGYNARISVEAKTQNLRADAAAAAEVLKPLMW